MVLKFRAYDRKYKSMDDVVQLDWWRDDLRVNDDTFSDYVVMQSTGLHDKNGIEIFEGDIVEIIYDSELFTGVVVYDLGETDFKATNNREDYGNNFQYLTVGESIKVIGNVHQYPELLKTDCWD